MKNIRHQLSKEQVDLLNEHCTVIHNGVTYYHLPFWIRKNDDDTFTFFELDNLPIDLVKAIKSMRESDSKDVIDFRQYPLTPDQCFTPEEVKTKKRTIIDSGNTYSYDKKNQTVSKTNKHGDITILNDDNLTHHFDKEKYSPGHYDIKAGDNTIMPRNYPEGYTLEKAERLVKKLNQSGEYPPYKKIKI